MKLCKTCGETKSVEDFRLLKGKYRQSWCKSCNKEYNKKYRTESYNIRKHGISEQQYGEMLAEQGGRCAICGLVPDQRLVIDHDHSCCSGQFSCGDCVRGLLCQKCNMGIGLLQDDIQNLESAIRYLIGG